MWRKSLELPVLSLAGLLKEGHLRPWSQAEIYARGRWEGCVLSWSFWGEPSVWSSGEERAWSLEKVKTSKDPTSLGLRGVGPKGRVMECQCC